MRNILTWCTIATVCLTALTRAATQGPTPQFNAAINFVEVPVRVVDSQGHAVAGLAVTDFELSESGALQQLAIADEVDARQTGSTSPRRLTDVPDRAETRQAPRVFSLVVDDNHLSAEVATKTAGTLRRFVDELNQSDLIGVSYTSGARGQEITGDRRAVRSALDRLRGHYDSLNNAMMQEHTARVAIGVVGSTVAALSSYANAMQGLANLVLVSSGVGCTESRRASDGGSAYCGTELTDAVSAAVASGVIVYSIDPAGLTVPSLDSPATVRNGRTPRSPGGSWTTGAVLNAYNPPTGSGNVFDAMRALAVGTGGFSVFNTERVSEGLESVLRETVHYYRLGYYSNHADAPAQIGTHISVRVKRHDVRVFYASERLRVSNAGHVEQ